MEFDFNVNRLLTNEITKVNQSNFQKEGAFSSHCDTSNDTNCRLNDRKRNQLCAVIDALGAASAKAQGLSGPITSASRLLISDHNLYILKDAKHGGQGAVIGILKIGMKKLFVFDVQGRQHELCPKCVLDFYVHESMQRMGCGKKLFEFALRSEAMDPQHLAIDRPSNKFLNFLKRHYNLTSTIPQVNNFVIFDGFLKRWSDKEKAKTEQPSNAMQKQGSIHHYKNHAGAIDILNWESMPSDGWPKSTSNSDQEFSKQLTGPESSGLESFHYVGEGFGDSQLMPRPLTSANCETFVGPIPNDSHLASARRPVKISQIGSIYKNQEILVPSGNAEIMKNRTVQPGSFDGVSSTENRTHIQQSWHSAKISDSNFRTDNTDYDNYHLQGKEFECISRQGEKSLIGNFQTNNNVKKPPVHKKTEHYKLEKLIKHVPPNRRDEIHERLQIHGRQETDNYGFSRLKPAQSVDSLSQDRSTNDQYAKLKGSNSGYNIFGLGAEKNIEIPPQREYSINKSHTRLW